MTMTPEEAAESIIVTITGCPARKIEYDFVLSVIRIQRLAAKIEALENAKATAFGKKGG
jgi:hypothetical protein